MIATCTKRHVLEHFGVGQLAGCGSGDHQEIWKHLRVRWSGTDKEVGSWHKWLKTVASNTHNIKTHALQASRIGLDEEMWQLWQAMLDWLWETGDKNILVRRSPFTNIAHIYMGRIVKFY